MDEPSKAANRVLLGTGFGLILVSGFAIIEDRMDIMDLGFGHIFLLLGAICLVTAKLLQSRHPLLSTIFPNETEAELKLRVDKEMNQINYENRVGNAWAELESKVLATEIDSEE